MLKLIGGFNMIGEGVFILAVSLSGSYDDLKYVSNFNDCSEAQLHYVEHCSEYKASVCLLEKYANIPRDHATVNAFDFDITEPQTCGFVGVDTRKKFLEDK